MRMDENLRKPGIAPARDVVSNKNDRLVSDVLRQNGVGVPDDV